MSNAICVKPHHYSQQSKSIVHVCERCDYDGFEASFFGHRPTSTDEYTLFFFFRLFVRARLHFYSVRISHPYTVHKCDSRLCMMIRVSSRQHKNARQTEINSMIDTISISHSRHAFAYRHIAVVHSSCLFFFFFDLGALSVSLPLRFVLFHQRAAQTHKKRTHQRMQRIRRILPARCKPDVNSCIR